jgi:hypothetical protein
MGQQAGRKTPRSGATKLVMLGATSPTITKSPFAAGFSAAC